MSDQTPHAGLVAATRGGVLSALANITVVGLFALLAYGSFERYTASKSLSSLGLLLVNALFVCLFITRREARLVTGAPALWALSFGGTVLPMMMRVGEASRWAAVGNGLQMLGIVLMIAALLSLQRSFGIVPANRGVRQGGLYRIVRHPLYLAELLLFLGVVIVSPTALNILLWILECGVQLLRARAEEEFLHADPAYRAYRERVRYRLIPGLI